MELSKEQDTITMAGGLIANASRDANGNLTNKGQAQVKASKLIIMDPKNEPEKRD